MMEKRWGRWEDSERGGRAGVFFHLKAKELVLLGLDLNGLGCGQAGEWMSELPINWNL